LTAFAATVAVSTGRVNHLSM